MSSYRVGFDQPANDDIPTLAIIDENNCIQVLQNREAKLVNGMLIFPNRWHVTDSCINTDGSLAVNIIFDGDEEC